MIPLHQFNWPFFSWWRKSYVDLIIQDLIPQCGGFLLFGRVFLVKKKVYGKQFARHFWICWTIRNILGAEPLNDIAWGTRMSPSRLRALLCALLVCVPYHGEMMAWHVLSGCSKWLLITGWWTAATLSWACGSAASFLGTKLLGKGGHSLHFPTCHWQSSGITAPHLNNDTAAGL